LTTSASAPKPGMFSVKISSVKGISISKTRLEFFNLKRSGGHECKIQARVVNARIKNFTKKIARL
jgi:hypothetical protein